MRIKEKSRFEEVDQKIIESLKDRKEVLTKYEKSDNKKAITQIINTFVPFIVLWILMYFSLKLLSFWLGVITFIALALVGGFFLVRIFVIQHDCGHQSFMRSKKTNNAIGFFCSFFSTIPYKYWAKVHNHHHGHNGVLEEEHRDVGDIPTLTVNEFRQRNWFGRLRYRIWRFPLVTFIVAPIFYFIVSNRFPVFNFKSWKNIKWIQLRNNIAIGAIYTLLASLIGWKKFLLIQFTLVMIFGIIAFWFFYVQHQHEWSYKYWKRNWKFEVSAIRGASFYNLPKLFHWLTGDIGYHHVHHLNSLIPNYHLKEASKEKMFQEVDEYVTKVTFLESLKMMFHNLWDEEREKMVSFSEFHRNEKVRLSA